MSVVEDHGKVSGAFDDFVRDKYDADFYRDAARSCVSCDRAGLKVLLARLRTKNADIAGRGNVSSAFSDWCWGMYGTSFYVRMARYCRLLDKTSLYANLQQAMHPFAAACDEICKTRTVRQKEGVNRVLKTWQTLQPYVESYRGKLEQEKIHEDEYKYGQRQICTILLVNMVYFAEHYEGGKNVKNAE